MNICMMFSSDINTLHLIKMPGGQSRNEGIVHEVDGAEDTSCGVNKTVGTKASEETSQSAEVFRISMKVGVKNMELVRHQ